MTKHRVPTGHVLVILLRSEDEKVPGVWGTVSSVCCPPRL